MYTKTGKILLGDNNGSSNISDDRKKILIAEDDPSVMEFLVEVFNEKFMCLTASNGKDAYKLFRQQQVLSLITDIYMPEMDGLQLIQKVRSYSGKIPIFVISGANKKYLTFARKAGANKIFEKPFEIEDLMTNLSALQ